MPAPRHFTEMRQLGINPAEIHEMATDVLSGSCNWSAPGPASRGCLASVKSMGKSNEITAIPVLLETLSLTNCIVTLDAMGCQKAIAGQILERGADYLLVIKANHSKAFLAVKESCEQHCFARGATAKPVFDAFDDSHGRLVRLRVFVCPEAADLEALDAWSGLRTVLAVETIRGVNGSGKVEAEIRYFLSSCRDDPAVLVQAIRRHWTIQSAPQAHRTGRSRMT